MKYLFLIGIFFVNIGFSQTWEDYVDKAIKANDSEDFIGAHYYYTKAIEISPTTDESITTNLYLERMMVTYSKDDFINVLRESIDVVNVFMKILDKIYQIKSNDISKFNELKKKWDENMSLAYMVKAISMEEMEKSKLKYDINKYCTKCDNVIQAVYYNKKFSTALSKFGCGREEIDNWGKSCKN
jgi:hypothetical protein